jgi:hypothetical protein
MEYKKGSNMAQVDAMSRSLAQENAKNMSRDLKIMEIHIKSNHRIKICDAIQKKY